MRERALIMSLVAAGGLFVGCGAESGPQRDAPSTANRVTTSTTLETTTIPETTPLIPNVGHAAINKDVIITFYAAFDNDPPGSKAIAHPDIQAEAGGTGTYKDPLTLAARSDVSADFKPGTEVYVPLLKKYFIRSDDCGESAFAPNGCETQIDLYMGNPSENKAVLSCEDALTPDGRQKVIINPPNNLPVSKQPLWNDKTGQCFNP